MRIGRNRYKDQSTDRDGQEDELPLSHKPGSYTILPGAGLPAMGRSYLRNYQIILLAIFFPQKYFKLNTSLFI